MLDDETTQEAVDQSWQHADVDAAEDSETHERQELELAPLSGNALCAAVLAFIEMEGEGRPKGVSFVAICNHVDPSPSDDVSAALVCLVADGNLFTTIDEGHFQCL